MPTSSSSLQAARQRLSGQLRELRLATSVAAGDAWLLRPGCAAAAAPLMPALHTASARRYSSTFMTLWSSDHIYRPDQRPWAGPRKFKIVQHERLG